MGGGLDSGCLGRLYGADGALQSLGYVCSLIRF